ncbi:hypothetical protein DESA109040_13695 [Deinococcus saxicola]
MLKLPLFTDVRVGELTNIKVTDVDLPVRKIFIDQGKGHKDRYFLFPQAFVLALRAYLAVHSKSRYLFETQRYGPYTIRRVQQIVQGYRVQAGLGNAVYPHLFRHQMLTFLTGENLSDAQIQLLSGHASKKSLEVYQHLSLEVVDGAYQQAVRRLVAENAVPVGLLSWRCKIPGSSPRLWETSGPAYWRNVMAFMNLFWAARSRRASSIGVYDALRTAILPKKFIRQMALSLKQMVFKVQLHEHPVGPRRAANVLAPHLLGTSTPI